MAAAKSPRRQNPTRQGAVPPDGLPRVVGAGGRVTTPPRRAKKNRQRGRNRRLITADQPNQNSLRHIHGPPPMRACRRTRKKSRSTSASFLPAMEGRATSTKSTGPASSC